MDNFNEFKKAYYGQKVCVCTKGGCVCFDPNSRSEVVGAQRLTYDEYLDIQITSLGNYRSYFEMCYFNHAMGFQGQIEKISKGRICFKRIFVSGMYPDGEMFDGKEDHVWMDQSGFESFQVGDCLDFFAEVYRYIKTGKGKLIDYSLQNPERIKKIGSYQLPSDDELMRQALNGIICETCFLSEQCNRTFCTLQSKKQRRINKLGAM